MPLQKTSQVQISCVLVDDFLEKKANGEHLPFLVLEDPRGI